MKRPHLDQTSLSPSRDSLDPSQDSESPIHYLLPSLPQSTHSCHLSSLLLLLSLALLNQMSVSTMDWPTEQVSSGKMDASTTVSVRMDTWDCTNVPRDAQQFLVCLRDVPWRLTPATTAVRWLCVVRPQPLPLDSQHPHPPNHQLSVCTRESHIPRARPGKMAVPPLADVMMLTTTFTTALTGALSILTYLQDVPRLLTPTIHAAWCQSAAPQDPHPTTLSTQPPPPILTSLPHPTILMLHHCLKERLWDTILPHRILTILHPNQHSVSTRDNNTPMDRLGKMDVTTTANVSIKPQAATSVPRGAHPSLFSLAASWYQARQTTAAKYSTVHLQPHPPPQYHQRTPLPWVSLLYQTQAQPWYHHSRLPQLQSSPFHSPEMFAYIMEGPTLKDRHGMLVVTRNVSVIMEEQDTIHAPKDVLSMRVALSVLWCLIPRILNAARCLSVLRVTLCPQSS